MPLHRLQYPVKISSICHFRSPLQQSSSSPILPLLQCRTATHAAQGRANKASANSPGRRLGAKKSSTQLVVPGNIIFRQRGTLWWPGENCGMGRDHTIFAREKGYVTYYKDGENGKKRIGVVFERGMTLPRGPGSARRRRLGLESREMTTIASVAEEGEGGLMKREESGRRGLGQVSKRNYMYRETNYEIGRAAEKANVPVPVWKPGDRFKAWRLRTAKRERAREKQALKGGKQRKFKRKGRRR